MDRGQCVTIGNAAGFRDLGGGLDDALAPMPGAGFAHGTLRGRVAFDEREIEDLPVARRQFAFGELINDDFLVGQAATDRGAGGLFF